MPCAQCQILKAESQAKSLALDALEARVGREKLLNSKLNAEIKVAELKRRALLTSSERREDESSTVLLEADAERRKALQIARKAGLDKRRAEEQASQHAQVLQDTLKMAEKTNALMRIQGHAREAHLTRLEQQLQNQSRFLFTNNDSHSCISENRSVSRALLGRTRAFSDSCYAKSPAMPTMQASPSPQPREFEASLPVDGPLALQMTSLATELAISAGEEFHRDAIDDDVSDNVFNAGTKPWRQELLCRDEQRVEAQTQTDPEILECCIKTNSAREIKANLRQDSSAFSTGKHALGDMSAIRSADKVDSTMHAELQKCENYDLRGMDVRDRGARPEHTGHVEFVTPSSYMEVPGITVCKPSSQSPHQSCSYPDTTNTPKDASIVADVYIDKSSGPSRVTISQGKYAKSSCEKTSKETKRRLPVKDSLEAAPQLVPLTPAGPIPERLSSRDKAIEGPRRQRSTEPWPVPKPNTEFDLRKNKSESSLRLQGIDEWQFDDFATFELSDFLRRKDSDICPAWPSVTESQSNSKMPDYTEIRQEATNGTAWHYNPEKIEPLMNSKNQDFRSLMDVAEAPLVPYLSKNQKHLEHRQQTPFLQNFVKPTQKRKLMAAPKAALIGGICLPTGSKQKVKAIGDGKPDQTSILEAFISNEHPARVLPQSSLHRRESLIPMLTDSFANISLKNTCHYPSKYSLALDSGFDARFEVSFEDLAMQAALQ